MNSSKHTPGPWTVSDGLDRQTGGEVIYGPDDGTWIASVHDFNRYDRDEERKANAAPDLLFACEELIAFIERETPQFANMVFVDAARGAVANARGEGEATND